MGEVVIYATPWCPYCVRARALLKAKGVDYREVRVDRDLSLRHEMMARSGRRTVPQIWVGETHIGGCTELLRLDQAGELDPLLAAVTGHQRQPR